MKRPSREVAREITQDYSAGRARARAPTSKPTTSSPGTWCRTETVEMQNGLAFDEGPGVGLGHRRRVEGLACGLVDIGSAVEMHVIGGGSVVGDVVLVDSYTSARRRPFRVYHAGTIIAIDDIERDLAVDLVVDDPIAGANAHVRSTASVVVTGAPYTLVDPELRALAPRRFTRPCAACSLPPAAPTPKGSAARRERHRRRIAGHRDPPGRRALGPRPRRRSRRGGPRPTGRGPPRRDRRRGRAPGPTTWRITVSGNVGDGVPSARRRALRSRRRRW